MNEEQRARGLRPVLAALLGIAGAACAREASRPAPNETMDDTEAERAERERMVALQIEARGVRDPLVLAAMSKVPRHLFVPAPSRGAAYADRPLPIGWEQTISQPYVVALMTQALELAPGKRVLEVGTGSGYQAAVLAEITPDVYTIEIVPELGRSAAHTLTALGYDSVRARIGDGYDGWPEAAPFDAIVVTAAPGFVPPALVEQLAPNGRLVLPVRDAPGEQHLWLVSKDAQGAVSERELGGVRFVPMTGKAQAELDEAEGR